MADQYGYFFNSVNGDRTYNADSLSEWLGKFFTTGVFAGDLQVLSRSGMVIDVQPGYADIRGKVRIFDEAETFIVVPASGVYPRIDTIVCRADYSTREISLKYVQGEYSGSTPVAPEPVRNAGAYELVLAQISVAAGATAITQAEIKDTRYDNELCGVVTGTVNEIDWSQITAQFEAFFTKYEVDAADAYEAWLHVFQNFSAQQQAEFTEWFETIRDQLDTDQAGHLQNQITDIQRRHNTEDSMKPWGFLVKSTVFNSDGSIVETDTNGVTTTTFNSDGSISEVWQQAGGVRRTKLTSFNADGSISETVTTAAQGE